MQGILKANEWHSMCILSVFMWMWWGVVDVSDILNKFILTDRLSSF